MTVLPGEASPERLAAFAKAAGARFGRDPIEFGAKLSLIWIVGAVERLVGLGVCGVINLVAIDGMDLWDEIDELRYLLLPPNIINLAIGAFANATSPPAIKDGIAKVLSLYYFDEDRERLTRASLEEIYNTSR